jgi:hypothetical protein
MIIAVPVFIPFTSAADLAIGKAKKLLKRTMLGIPPNSFR